MNTKVKTTITIEADLLEQVKNAAKDFRNQSEVVEKALREYLPKLKRKPSKRKLTREEEIELMNRYADEHREELLETLSYQIDW
jgi:metal-responsive CopG/Arc/MetJ family transcriptional regulator